jgi:hypothetical protein
VHTYIQNTEQHTSITKHRNKQQQVYHAHDELQKTTTRGLEMYWAYAGRTNNNNNNNKIPPSEMLTILASAESDEDTKSNLV